MLVQQNSVNDSSFIGRVKESTAHPYRIEPPAFEQLITSY